MPYKNKEEQKEYQRNHYQQNKQLVKDRLIERRYQCAKWFHHYKRDNCKCEKCGEDHPACIDFHHKDPSDKIEGISDMVAWGFSYKKILAEVAKCNVWCANCHRRFHWKEKQKDGTARYIFKE